MTFVHDDFLLQTDAARHLYHAFAENEPILDYHTHLSPLEIANNQCYENLAEVWLGGDHYKWRAMRANGVAERLCTGDADPYDKFLAWARTVPCTLRNPLYHWTHLELKRYFDIDELLNEETAPQIWRQANERLQTERMTPQGIVQAFNVRALCTTDDPTDDLAHHRAIRDSGLSTKVFPTFRPDRALAIGHPHEFNNWVDRLAAAADTDIGSFTTLLEALQQRHDLFHEHGCRLSDHGLECCFDRFCSDEVAAVVFAKARAGRAVSHEEAEQYASQLMLHFGRWDAEKGWVKQLHLGARRNTSSRLLSQLGPDVGCDSIGDWPQAAPLAHYLDQLDREQSLPKMVLYNVNPADNCVFATMIGNFQSSGLAGKLQWGSGWWFLDQWEGMQSQMNTLSNQGLLSRFIGMLTDSRSFLSFPRHEYFRRCLCDLLGRDVERGAIPNDDRLLGPMIRNICYANAAAFLQLPM